MGEPVYLYQYDLSNGMARSLGPMLVGRPVEGIWHTSLVLYGVEVWFGQGIHVKSPPGTTHHGPPLKTVSMGDTALDRDTFFEYLDGMRDTYHAERYHLLEFNCNHFTNDVVGFLNGGSIPLDILNQPQELIATPFGQQMRPMIEQMFVGANRRSAGDAVNNLLPAALGQTLPPSRAPPLSARVSQSRDDVPSVSSVASNLQIVTSIASLRSTLARCPGTAIMFTSASCPPCTAVRPHFEDLARRYPALTFCLVETGLGQGSELARLAEFGGPVSATPTFAFFRGSERFGECQRGTDRVELDEKVARLDREVFPPHPHTHLDVANLSKLSRTLAPITFPTLPPEPAFTKKLVLSTERLASEQTRETLRREVPEYLASLGVDIVPSTPPPAPLDRTFVSRWFRSTLEALREGGRRPDTASSSGAVRRRRLEPGEKFPIVDLVRIGFARDPVRLGRLVVVATAAADDDDDDNDGVVDNAAEGNEEENDTETDDANVEALLETLIHVIVEDLDEESSSSNNNNDNGNGNGDIKANHAYLVTAIKLVSNLFGSDVVTDRILSPSSSSSVGADGRRGTWLSDVTRLVIRAVLDEDDKARSYGAGLGWTLVAKVFERRTRDRQRRASTQVEESRDVQEEEWESELGGALLEALSREDKSLEVVHRLIATLGLLVYKSPYHEQLRSLFQVLEATDVLDRKRELVDMLGGKAGEGQKNTRDIIGVIEDVKRLLE